MSQAMIHRIDTYGHPSLGSTRTPEQIITISKSQQGKTLQKETIEKIKEGNTGLKRSNNTILKMKSHQGNFSGHKHSEATKKAISESAMIPNKNSVTISILTANGDIIYKCYGNFKKICLENDLPFSALKTSLKNGKGIYTSASGKTRAKTLGFEEYIGWKAIRT